MVSLPLLFDWDGELFIWFVGRLFNSTWFVFRRELCIELRDILLANRLRISFEFLPRLSEFFRRDLEIGEH